MILQKVAVFGRLHQDCFAPFLELPNGIPSPDTFERVFARLDPAQIKTCFERWITHLDRLVNPTSATSGGRRTIAIDGKTLRGSNKAHKTTAQKLLHLASAWSHEAKLVLGQVRCNEKSNEITAIPQLLGIIDLSGAMVTIDALGYQKEIAQKLHENNADYALALKDNHQTLHTGRGYENCST